MARADQHLLAVILKANKRNKGRPRLHCRPPEDRAPGHPKLGNLLDRGCGWPRFARLPAPPPNRVTSFPLVKCVTPRTRPSGESPIRD
jgi:hypothetical protein